MKVLFKKSFIKQYQKLPLKIQKEFRERVALFRDDPQNRSLNVHRLRGNKKHLSSLNVTGDCRALFQWVDEETIRFRHIGTHSQLY